MTYELAGVPAGPPWPGLALETAAALAVLLPPGSETPAESGLTAVLESVSGGALSVAVSTVPAAGGLTDSERKLLWVRGAYCACRRRGMLLTSRGIAAAETEAVLMHQRLPGLVRRKLGIRTSGVTVEGEGSVTLSRALQGLGARRTQLQVAASPGRRDVQGRPQVVYCEALLTLSGVPLALVTARVYGQFAAAFPLPWPLEPRQRPAAR